MGFPHPRFESDFQSRTARWVGLFLLAGFALLGSTPGTAEAGFPGRNGELAVVVVRDKGDCGEVIDCLDLRLRLVDPRSGRQRRLEICEMRDCDDNNPAWSPDGTRLAFARNSRGRTGIFSVRADGSDLQPMGGGPIWSPSGDQVVYPHTRQRRRVCCQLSTDLHISNVDGSEARRLTTDGDDPAWSSRGRIAFVRRDRRFDNIYTIRPDGTGLRHITRRWGQSPNWSPDGRWIVLSRPYVRRDGRVVDDLAMVSGRGGRVRRLTRAGGARPVWSPDGTQIAFVRGRRLMILTLASRRVRELIRVPRSQELGGIDWQPLPGSRHRGR